jgi:hypothetical protein
VRWEGIDVIRTRRWASQVDPVLDIAKKDVQYLVNAYGSKTYHTQRFLPRASLSLIPFVLRHPEKDEVKYLLAVFQREVRTHFIASERLVDPDICALKVS